MKRKLNLRDLAFYMVIVALLLWMVAAFSSRNGQDDVEYSQIVTYFRNEEVSAFSVSDSGVLTVKLQDGSVRRHALADLSVFHSDLGQLILEQQEAGIL